MNGASRKRVQRFMMFWGLALLLGLLLLGSAGEQRLAASGEPGTLTTWTVPTANPSLSGIALGPGGEVFFGEFSTSKVGRLDPGTNVITEWTVGAGPNNLALGPGGELYLTETLANRIARLSPNHNFYSAESIPTAGSKPEGIIVTSDGALEIWFTERMANKLGRLTVAGFVFDMVQPQPPVQQPVAPLTSSLSPIVNTVSPQFTPGNPALPPPIAMAPETTTGPFTEWDLMTGAGQPRMMALAPDGSIWISTNTDSIIHFDAGTIMIYGLPSGSKSFDVAVDPAGNVWFTESWGDKIGLLEPTTGDVTEWPLTSGSQPLYLVLAPDGSVWFSERSGDRIGHLEPWSNTITEYQLAPDTHPLNVALDAGGDLWFVSERQGLVGRLHIGPVLGPPPVPPAGDAITGISVNRISDTEADIIVNYNYTGSQGFPVYLGAWPTQSGTRASGFGFIPARIDAPGSGTLTVRVEYHSTTCLGIDGFDVFMYRGGQAPFVERNFSYPFYWGVCGAPVPPPPPSGLPTVNLDIDRGCGANYNPGEPLTVSFNVSETASVTLIDFETGGNIKQTSLGTVPGGASRTITGFVGGPAGVETLVLVARTLSGVYVSTGCSFGIGGVSPSLVSLNLDRGCGGLYHYGEVATVTMQSAVAGQANLFNVTRDGRIAQLMAGRVIMPGMGLNVQAPVSGVSGRSTLVLQVISTSGQRLSAACSMNVLP